MERQAIAPEDAARVRRFNRAVTTEVGALDASFLGRGRPLGEAGMLYALGPEGGEVSAAWAKLGLASRLASRLLRSLEAQGLVETVPHPQDGRRRMVRPTAQGRAELRSYDRLSDARARETLKRCGRAAPDLLAAMDRIACALNRDRIRLEIADPEAEAARACLSAYYAELAARFSGGFEVGRSRDPDEASLRRPVGAFFLALCDDAAVGCAALKGDGGWGEVKRVWVTPAARGLGLSVRLMAAVETEARRLGMSGLRLHTNRALPEAQALYPRLGYREVPAFNDEPYAERFYEKRLD